MHVDADRRHFTRHLSCSFHVFKPNRIRRDPTAWSLKTTAMIGVTRRFPVAAAVEDYRLHAKLKAALEPFAFEEYRKKKAEAATPLWNSPKFSPSSSQLIWKHYIRFGTPKPISKPLRPPHRAVWRTPVGQTCTGPAQVREKLEAKRTMRTRIKDPSKARHGHGVRPPHTARGRVGSGWDGDWKVTPIRGWSRGWSGISYKAT